MLNAESFFYEGSAEALAVRLRELSRRLAEGDLWQGSPRTGIDAVSRYRWSNLIPEWDNEIEKLGT